MQFVEINAQKRESFGKKAASDLKKEGHIPAVIYARDGVQHILVSPKEIKAIVYTPDFKIAQINIEGETIKAIIKDIQFHPVSDEVAHIDFLRLIDGVKISFQVPVVFKGVSPGVKMGGKLVTTLRKVKLKGTPDTMIDHIVGNISGLKMGQTLRIRDLEIPEGIEILNSGATPVGLVEIPRSAKTGAIPIEEEPEEAEA